jgi:hypothetical protein
MKNRFGIIRYGHWLGYGFDHGFGRWLPYTAQRPLVHLWNAVSCALLGHGHLFQDEPDGPVECSQCCRLVDDPGDGVIRCWEIWEGTDPA